MISRSKFYSGLRQDVGNRMYVARLLHVCPSTLWRREFGRVPITEEMILALAMLKSNHDAGNRPEHIRD